MMLVYIETNFLVEIALGQEQSKAAKKILELTEAKKVSLFIPAFSVNEPIWAVQNRGKNREQWLENLVQAEKTLISDLSRSELYVDKLKDYQSLSITLKTMGTKENNQLRQAIKQILSVCTALETNGEVFEKALNYETSQKLALQDAIVYAAVVNHLQKAATSEEKCFLSRDKKAFSSTAIRNELIALNCRYIDGFENGLSYINSSLDKKSES